MSGDLLKVHRLRPEGNQVAESRKFACADTKRVLGPAVEEPEQLDASIGAADHNGLTPMGVSYRMRH
jgi:hypothetical protein